MATSKFLRSSVILGVFSFVASFVGLLRDRVFASHFGASRTLDIYYSAFKLPDLVFNLFVLGAVSSAFIPIFIRTFREDEEGAWQVSHNFLTIMVTTVILACGLMIIFVRPLAGIIAPGFVGQDREAVISLMRLMFISPILFSISTIIGSILQALERFWAFAIAPIFYNVGIIIGAIYFVPLVEAHGYRAVLGLGLGVLLGACMHLGIQLVAALRAGFKFRPRFNLFDTNFRSMLRLMIPRTLGLGAYSIDSAVINAVASLLGIGSIAVLNVANNLQFVPISVVGISIAIAVFPKLSNHASADEREEFHHKLSQAMRNTAFVVIPLSIAGFFLAHWGINLLFGIGLYRGSSVDLTASVLMAFMFGIPAQSLIPILSRAFYALQNTMIPVVVSLIAIVINWTGAWLFAIHYHGGLVGLAAAFSVAGNVNFFLLWFSFRRFTKASF